MEKTATSGTASPAQNVALSDSLMDLIDQAHAESATEAKEGNSASPPPASDSTAKTPPDGKALPAGSDKQDAKAPEAKAPAAKEEKKPDSVDLFKKRLNEQTAVNSRIGRELKAAQEQIKTLEAKLAGTYEAPSEPSEDQQRAMAEFRGKELASRRMASEKYGEDFVNSQIYGTDTELSPFRELIAEKPWIQMRVAQSDNPVEEALRILREQKIYADLGPDPDQWEQALTEKIRAQVMKDIADKQKADASALVGTQVPGVGKSRSTTDERTPGQLDEEFSLASLGGHFMS